MFFKRQERFSIRKFKVGVFSVFLGALIVGTPTALAEEPETVASSVAETVVSEPAGTDGLAAPETATSTVTETAASVEASAQENLVAPEAIASAVTETATSEQASSQESPASSETPVAAASETKPEATSADVAVQPADKTALQAEVERLAHVAEEDRYVYATTKADYDKALEAAKALLKNDRATQEEVDQALKALQVADKALNGVKPVAPSEVRAEKPAEAKAETASEEQVAPEDTVAVAQPEEKPAEKVATAPVFVPVMPQQVVVADITMLTDYDRERIARRVLKVNPQLTADVVFVGPDGTVTIRYQGATYEIEASKTVRAAQKFPEGTGFPST